MFEYILFSFEFSYQDAPFGKYTKVQYKDTTKL